MNPTLLRTERPFFYAVALLTLLGAVLRAAAAGDEFWFDEIWSWWYALNVESVGAIFFGESLDNNHPLNTLYIHLLGDRPNWMLYRVPSVCAGIATAPLAAAIVGRQNRGEALAAAALFAAAYPMVVYSSEARGYGPAVALSLAAFLFLSRALEGRGRGHAVGFVVCVIAGMLYHLTVLYFYAGALVWSVANMGRGGAEARRKIFGLLSLHLIPAMFAAAYYFLRIRSMGIGGGEGVALLELLERSAAMALGMPETAWTLAAALVIASGLLVGDLVLLARARDDRWIFYLTTMIPAPAALIFLSGIEGLYVRYLLIPLAFFILVLARWFGRLWRAGGAAARTPLLRAGAVALLIAICAGHLQRDFALIRLGRSRYLDALAFMAQRAEGNTIRLAGDHDFRHRLALGFYARYYEREGVRIVYVERENRADGEFEWFLAHRFSREPPPEPAITAGERRLELQAAFPHAGPSGWALFVYR